MEVNCEGLEKVLVGSDPERFFQIGSELPPQEKSALTAFLRQNLDVFAWDPYEAPGVDPDFICHRLNVNPAITPKRGIEANPDQIRAIHNLQPPRDPKEVQKLTGMIAALNRFISRSADRCKPFFLLLHKWKGFEWNEDCAVAFQQLKEYLTRPPIMSSPNADEVLFAYIAVASHAVSLVLIREDNGTQRPVYYVSKSLQEAETRYLPLEKAILAIVQATRKLPHYFQAHTVVVLTQLPIKSILRSADYTSRIAKWGTILGAFDIRYMPRTAVKGQVLADLIAEFAEPTLEEQNVAGPLGADEKMISTVSQHENTWWKAHVDGAANQRGSGLGLVLLSPEGITIEKSLRLGFSATNNEAEYEALLEGMGMIWKLGGKSVDMFSDSRLIVGQINGDMEAKDERMQKYLVRVKHLQTQFHHFRLTHVPRSGNTHADSLATLATSSAQPLPRVILVEEVLCPSTEKANGFGIHNIRAGPSWMDPIVLYLKHDTLPDDKVEAGKIRRKATRFWLSEDSKLYRRSFSGPYLLCVHPEAAELILEELHEGICGSHTGGRSLSHRALTLGFWWPSMHKEALDYVKKCDQCQRFTLSIHQPGGELNPMSSPWPFAQWGLDILGPFPKATRNRKFLLVGTDYFTKWSNGQAEAVNKTIMNGLKKRLDDAKGRWVEELAHVLWTYRTMPRRSTGETPFSMTYGAEAVIPLEVNFPTQRTTTFCPATNDKLLEMSLDLIDERMEGAMVHLANYQQKLKQGYDAKVKSRPLAPGDLVLRKFLGIVRNPAWGKLGPNWEGPYRITSVAGIGAYFLEDLDERVVPRPWNLVKK
ncbi:protein NYNRIN-like [Quercus lobata]|uniref:protein NYNRIN-like n=1 Tax=Quercus lobata TaxID=97700 RepID=UPI0012485231|nr:protein NYNRIN-like [Quercus lobata]